MRDLDKAIAEALGYEVEEISGILSRFKPGYRIGKALEMYSTDGNSMLELIDTMASKGYEVWIVKHLETKLPISAQFFKPESRDLYQGWLVVEADTLPEAVAKAAYKALTGEEWREDK